MSTNFYLCHIPTVKEHIEMQELLAKKQYETLKNKIEESTREYHIGKRSCGCLGTLNEKVKITKELLVGIEKEKAIILLMWNGKTKEEAEKIYSDFRKEYLNNGKWL